MRINFLKKQKCGSHQSVKKKADIETELKVWLSNQYKREMKKY